MAGPFALDYFVFVFLAALGVLQVVAAYTGMRGLLLIPFHRLAVVVGLTAVVLAFLWFFLSEPRNLADTEGGLDGNQMAGYFALGAGSATVLTFLLSSISNRSLAKNGRRPLPGLDALRETTYWTALARTLRSLWKHYRVSTQK